MVLDCIRDVREEFCRLLLPTGPRRRQDCIFKQRASSACGGQERSGPYGAGRSSTSRLMSMNWEWVSSDGELRTASGSNSPEGEFRFWLCSR